LLSGIAKGNNEQCNITVTDITKRKIVEEKLLRSEKELKKAQQISHVGSWYLDLATNQVMWTEELYKMYGFDPALPPPPYTEHQKLFTPESWDVLSYSLSKTRDSGIPYELELKTLRQDGSNGWMWVRGETVHDKDGKTIGLWGAAQDITERKKVENSLREANSFLNSILENIPNMIFIKEVKDLRFVRFNRAGEELIGISREEMEGKSDYDFFSKEIADYYIENDRLVLRNKKIIDIQEEQINTRNNGIRTLHTKKVPILNAFGEPEHLLGISEDITEKKQYDQMITQAVIDSEDKQRVVFAQELHDGLGPMLATIKLFLKSMQNKKEKENIEYLIDRVNEIIGESIIILKELSLNMSPHILTNHGLNCAVEDFLNRTKTGNISMIFKSNLDCRLSNTIETGLYRIITELINNSVKHAGAGQIKILINNTDNNIILEYSDNGCGFDLNSMLQTNNGNGLFNIINRVKSMDAIPNFKSSYGNGFSFNADIKL